MNTMHAATVLPSPENENSLLLVFLTELCDAGDAKLVQRLQQSLPNIQLQTWHPSKLMLQSVAHQGPHPDSQANLCGLAILAHRSGWSSFIVADGLTNRQANDTTRQGEDPEISVIMVAIRSARQDGGEDRIRVFAKRTEEGAMWEIFWKMFTAKRNREYCQPPYLFVDQQSGIDQTVLIVDPDYWYGEDRENRETVEATLLKDVKEPRLRGFLYGRINGREAHICYANLNTSNMGFDELTKDVNKFPRPSWPGHGILRDEDEEDSEV